MRYRVANHSSYPGPAAGPARGEAALTAVLRDQEAAGVDLITDGQLGSPDLVSPLLGGIDGVRLGPLRPLPAALGRGPRPIVQAKLRRHHALAVDAYQRAARHAHVPVKAVLTGPYTLAHAAEIATTAYRTILHLAEDLSVILASEVAALVAAGAPAIQIDEPLILHRPADVRLLRALLDPVYDATGGSAQVFIATYGTDAAALYAQLNSLPGDVIAVDCANRAALTAAIAETGAGKPLALGIVDGAAPAVEGVDDLTRLVERCLHRYVHAEVTLQPSCGVGGLSIAQARGKLNALAGVRAALQSTSPKRPDVPA